jgi:hypothetical protein
MAAGKSVTDSEYKRTPQEVAGVEEPRDERTQRGPRLKVSRSENVLKIGPDHPDEARGNVLLMEALAAIDPDFVTGLVSQLARAGGGEVDEQRLNFMLSVVRSIKPRDQVEAMLAAQMAAVHTATMRFSRNLAEAEYLDLQDSAERTFNKLTRTFVIQMDALKRYRTGGEQAITVQHVNVSEGGQAIVGNVTQGKRDAAPVESTARSLDLARDNEP